MLHDLLGKYYGPPVSFPLFITRFLFTLHSEFDEFRFCCLARGVEKCLPEADEFSSCEDLMSNYLLRITIWILGTVAFFGNLLVFIWRVRDDRNGKVILQRHPVTMRHPASSNIAKHHSASSSIAKRHPASLSVTQRRQASKGVIRRH